VDSVNDRGTAFEGPGLPIVHVQEEGGGGLVEVAVRQQLLQLLHQVVFVRGAETAELVQQVLVQIVVEVHDRWDIIVGPISLSSIRST